MSLAIHKTRHELDYESGYGIQYATDYPHSDEPGIHSLHSHHPESASPDRVSCGARGECDGRAAAAVAGPRSRKDWIWSRRWRAWRGGGLPWG
ncbi:hypothetical protein An11g04850 [Aspergillus niger]|uniref:Uncharacterized protein n=2 Tax=Aspergillus niger TaxID=5061 RepID=A2QWE3_ASPNC|nr:hypothetical protein An11g04850 [Aspergillus niger]CAK40689.1 hypothetical protein An11g04850 [Aspergillus niger]